MVNISIAILAGGSSKRFGADKTISDLNGIPMISHIVASSLSTKSLDIFLLAKKTDKFSFLKGIRVINDDSEISCTMSGFITGFKEARNDLVFFIAADMPFFNFSTVPIMKKHIFGKDAVVPYINGRYFCCSALYNKSCSHVFDTMFKNRDYRLLDALEKLNYEKVSERDFHALNDVRRTFMNINTPLDYDKALVNTGGLLCGRLNNG